MIKTAAFLYACLLVASPVAADTLVTWVAEGEMTWVSGHPFRLTPPIGTPVSVTLSFAPDSARPTYPWIGPEAGCMQLDNVSASMTIGGHTWSGSGINAYTNAFLPGTDCYSNGFTQFHLIGLTPPADRPWDLPIDLMLYYKELLVPGAFPEVPTPVSNPFPAPIHAGALLTNIEPRPVGWGFVAELDLRAVQQPTPVPEPGTLALLGLGLAAVARSRRRR